MAALYFTSLVHTARQRLQHASRGSYDEEDVALSAFDSFCRGAEAGRFPELHNRDDLWSLLLAITMHKATDRMRREGRQKRGGGQTIVDLDTLRNDGLDQVLDKEPSPELAAMLTEQLHRLMDLLPDDDLRFVAVSKFEGHTDTEVAEKLGCARRTVVRKLAVIRGLWAEWSES